MDNLHDEIVLDYPFLNHCYSRFKSPANALRHLEKVRNPPKVVSTKRRSPEIETAVEFLACLVAHNAFVDHDGHDNGALSHISSRRNGIAIFVSWVLFLLTNVVLAEELPTTIDGVKARARSFAYIPYLIGFPNDQSILLSMMRSYPSLQPLLMQGWCKSIDETDPTWGFWSMLVANLFYGSTALSSFRPNPQGLSGGPYTEGEDLGLMFTRHLHHEARRVRFMPVDELRHLKMYVLCLSPGATLREGPFQDIAVRVHCIPALILLVSKCLKRRFVVHTSSTEEDSREITLIHEVVSTSLSYLKELMDGTLSVRWSLNAGIVKVLLHIPTSLFAHDRAMPSELSLVGRATEALEGISKFLVYPPILHAFLKSVDRLSTTEIERTLLVYAPAVWMCWISATEKASALRALRRELKRNPSFMCSNPNCLSMDLSFSEGEHRKRGHGKRSNYSVCSSCETMMYCSVECQRVQWRGGHRAECQTYREIREASLLQISDYDTQFGHAWMQVYLRGWNDLVWARIAAYRSTLSRRLSTLTEEERLILSEIKTPLAVLDLMQPGLPDESCLSLTNVTAFSASEAGKLYPSIASEVLTTWRGQRVDNGTLLVVGLFPRDGTHPWLFYKVLDLPSLSS
ncbi:hypothetical protein PM082_022809 [Marasmius tenuissimus]|nr:hypothetical protein PM082_024722 [Marasmius tenuissimus]KAJ8095902.1 hypothetical protein PM082_022809 [Marasmius tenuissimus]